MPRIFDGHRLAEAGIDGHRLRAVGQSIAAASAHVNWQSVARIGLAAALSGGNPAAIGKAALSGLVANLADVLPSEAHQKAASDAIVAGNALANAFTSIRGAVASAQAPNGPPPAA